MTYHYIYKITCIANNKFYIGMHSTSNLEDGYMGGGKIIKSSIKKYGKKLHKKEILEFLPNRKALANREAELINENLINEPNCMNIKLGGEGGLYGNINVRDKNGKILTVSVNDPRYLSGELENLTKGMVPVKDKEGNTLMVSVNDPRYLSGELENLTKGMVPVKDKEGNTLMVSVNDPRYLSGELIHTLSGRVSVRDKEGNTFSTYTNDPRYLSGELVSAKKGIPLSDSHKENLGKITKGTIWINNGVENKRIFKDQFYKYENWNKGRTTKKNSN